MLSDADRTLIEYMHGVFIICVRELILMARLVFVGVPGEDASGCTLKTLNYLMGV